MNIVNLTPHALTVGNQTFQPSGSVARVETVETVSGEVNGFPVVQRVMGAVQGLPGQVPDTIYLVSAMVLSACKGRTDVFAPDTGATAIRENGQVVAVTRLIAA